MTRERFLSLRFRPFMELDFITKRGVHEETFIPVMLLAIDWDNDVLKVVPFPRTNLEEIEFWTSIDHIESPKPKLKITK